VAGRGWTTVAVGCQLGSQLGYSGHLANPPDAPARRRPPAAVGDAGGQGRDRGSGRPVSLLPLVPRSAAGLASVAVRRPQARLHGWLPLAGSYLLLPGRS
jgi:hypothetical protein